MPLESHALNERAPVEPDSDAASRSVVGSDMSVEEDTDAASSLTDAAREAILARRWGGRLFSGSETTEALLEGTLWRRCGGRMLFVLDCAEVLDRSVRDVRSRKSSSRSLLYNSSSRPKELSAETGAYKFRQLSVVKVRKGIIHRQV